MHIAALDPRFLRREEVTQDTLDREREIYREQAKSTGKPEPVIEKIVNGKMEKFYEENCLYEQHFIKDEGVTVKELVDQAIAKMGENIAIRRFSRFKVGEMDGPGRGCCGIRVASFRTDWCHKRLARSNATRVYCGNHSDILRKFESGSSEYARARRNTRRAKSWRSALQYSWQRIYRESRCRLPLRQTRQRIRDAPRRKAPPVYQRIVVKLSGESLSGPGLFWNSCRYHSRHRP